jgi:hypothetical protein
MHKVGSALRNLGTYFEESGASIRDALSHALDGWSGLEADAANVFFTQMSQDVSSIKDPLATVAQNFEDLAMMVSGAADSVQGLFNTMLDLLLTAVVLSTSIGWTGVGTVVAANADAGIGATIAFLAVSAYKIIQSVFTIYNTFEAVVAIPMTFFSVDLNISIPASYENPTVDEA